MPEFVEFAGKGVYKCPRCKGNIRYARFFGPDKNLLTTDGNPANNKFGRDSNTGFATNPETKQMHECPPKDVPESQLKKIDTLDSGWGDTKSLKVKEFPLDEIIIKKQIEEDNKLLPLIWARYMNVKNFVLSKDETNPALFGLVFKILTKADKDE